MLNTADHQALALEAARQGMVLLKNVEEALPLDAARALSIAVVGPHANATEALLGNYQGIPPFIISPFEGIKGYVKSSTLAPGCGINSTDKAELAAAEQAAAKADVTIMVLGIDLSVENEGVDRKSILLPQPQIDLAKKVIKGQSIA